MASVEQKVRADDRAWLVKQPQFQRFLLDITEASGISRTTHEEPNALRMEGKRSLGLDILGWFAEDGDPLSAMCEAKQAWRQFTRSE